MFIQRPFHALSTGAHSFHLSSKEAVDDAATDEAPPCMVTCLYQAYIAGCWRNVTIEWSRSHMNHFLSLTVNSLEGEICYNSKFDVTPWNSWTKKGSKTFIIDERQVDLYWNLSSAKFSDGPEPCSDFYVALVSCEEVVLLLGDRKEKVFSKTKARPALAEPVQFRKKEIICSKKCFATKAKLNERKRERDIVVDTCTTRPSHPEMWISIDGLAVIHVKNLQWNFRGSRTIFVSEQPLHVSWDVYDWFTNSGSGHGLFIFQVGAADSDDDETSSQGTSNSNASDNNKYSSAKSNAATSDFCLFLYAWKIK